MRFWLQLTWIPALALVGASASAWLHERPKLEQLQADPWARSAEEVTAMPSVLWVDARSAGAYGSGHLDGAVNVSLDQWESGFETLMTVWDPDSVLVVYCDGEGCQLSRETAERLRLELGDDRVYWLKGGLEAWHADQP